MSMADYGVMIRIDDKFINKDSQALFLPNYTENGNTPAKFLDNCAFKDNYFCYCGDEHFCIAFYKTCFIVVSDGKLIYTHCGVDFDYEQRLFDNLPSVTIRPLNNTALIPYNLDALGSYEQSHISMRQYLRYCKAYNRARKRNFLVHVRRAVAEWDYNGHHYEVIYGYGVEPNEASYALLRDRGAYDYTDYEKTILDSWFKED